MGRNGVPSVQGRVKFFNAEKHFGFVTNEGGTWFLHGRDILGDEPRAGDTVEFWLDDDRQRPELRAVEIKILVAELRIPQPWEADRDRR
jgi:cold shock CspA family protein